MFGQTNKQTDRQLTRDYIFTQWIILVRIKTICLQCTVQSAVREDLPL